MAFLLNDQLKCTDNTSSSREEISEGILVGTITLTEVASGIDLDSDDAARVGS